MKNKEIGYRITLILLIATFLSGCTKPPTAPAESNANRHAVTPSTSGAQSATPSPSVSGGNSNTQPAPSSPGLPAPPVLLGKYALTEVQQKEQVTIIRSQVETLIEFRADGSFQRESKLDGKVDHTDSGDFSIEGTDILVLRIQRSKGKPQNPPVIKRHVISLSPDGSELRMTSGTSRTAIFRRRS